MTRRNTDAAAQKAGTGERAFPPAPGLFFTLDVPPTAIPIKLSANYSRNERPAQLRRKRCRSRAFLLFAGWINETSQTSPFRPGVLLGTR